MPNEIIIRGESREKAASVLKYLNPMALFHLIRDRFTSKTPDALFLSPNELTQRVETLYVVIKEQGEKTIKLGNDTFCRVFINDKNETLEFRVGSEPEVKATRFRELVNLEILVQVNVDANGHIFRAVQANLEKQSKYEWGPSQYTFQGIVYGGPEYMRDIQVIATFTNAGHVEIPLTPEMKQAQLERVFAPLHGVILQLTEGETPRKFMITPRMIIEKPSSKI